MRAARHLLIGFDGSEPAHAALRWAEDVAQRNHVCLTIVLVVHRPWFAGIWPVLSSAPAACELERAAIDALRTAVGALAQDVSVVWQVSHGPVGAVLEREAFRHDCDAIVIGRGHRQRRPWPGTIERYLRWHVLKPVVVVPLAGARIRTRPLTRQPDGIAPHPTAARIHPA